MLKTTLLTAATCATLILGAPLAETQAGEAVLSGDGLA